MTRNVLQSPSDRVLQACFQSNTEPHALPAALGVIGMLRRLTLWTEEDAWNGNLTILPKNITAWLHNTSRWVTCPCVSKGVG